MSNETDESNNKQRDGADKSESNVADSATQALFNDYYESTQGQSKANSESDSVGKSGGSMRKEESGTLEIPSLDIDSDKSNRGDVASGEAQQSNGASTDATRSEESIIRDPNAPRPPRNTELWPDMTKEREQRQERATQDIVDSVLNNGAFPADMAQHLAGFGAGRGYEGDVSGLNDFVRNINDRLRAAGSDFRLNVSEHRHDNLSLRDSSFMSGYTDHTVSLVRGVDRSPVDSVTIKTSVSLRPGVRT